MSSEQEETTVEFHSQSNNNIVVNETEKFTFKKRFTFKDFIKISGFTLIILFSSIVLMIVGLVLFYNNSEEVYLNTGFWLILIGVITFMFVLIVGFEKIN